MYVFGFAAILILWTVLTSFCYLRIIVFDNGTLSGAMISGLILSVTILSTIRFLKRTYDEIFNFLSEKPDTD